MSNNFLDDSEAAGLGIILGKRLSTGLSKCGPQTSDMGITWEQLVMQNLETLSQTH